MLIITTDVNNIYLQKLRKCIYSSKTILELQDEVKLSVSLIRMIFIIKTIFTHQAIQKLPMFNISLIDKFAMADVNSKQISLLAIFYFCGEH